MPHLQTADGVRIAYDWHGAGDGPVMLLIMGLGVPSAAWPPEFIAALTDAGFRVLTFDNRDTGQSEILERVKTPSVALQLLRYKLRLRVRAPYQLSDMAADALALLDQQGVSRAHVIGVSMGGMIAQALALENRQRLTSLTSIMSSTGERGLPGPTAAVRRYMLRNGVNTSDDALRRYHEGFWPLVSSPSHPFTDAELTEFLDRLFARGMSSSGTTRQLLAILAAPGRKRALEALRLPTLVVHGDADLMLPVECGYATAEAIRDAEIMIVEGLGHDFPQVLIPRITDAIVAHARVADVEGETAGSLVLPSTA